MKESELGGEVKAHSAACQPLGNQKLKQDGKPRAGVLPTGSKAKVNEHVRKNQTYIYTN